MRGLLLVLLLAPAPLWPQRPDTLRSGHAAEVGFDAARLQQAVSWVQQQVEAGHIPGAQLLVARRGVIVAHASFGLMDIEARRPLTDSSLLWFASITKPFTAAAVMKLVDQGKLGLGDPVARYLPQFRDLRLRGDTAARVRPITVWHLLTHTSGLGESPTRRSTMGAGWLDQRISDVVDSIAADRLRFAPGTDYNYANAGYVALGRIVEVISGQPFDRYLRAEILDPLGLRDTYVVTEFTPTLAPRIAKVYDQRPNALQAYFAYDPGFSYRNVAPNGGLFGTAPDLARFAQMFLNGGTYGGRRLLAPATARLMVSDQTPNLSVARGLGWTAQWPIAHHGVAHRAHCTFGHTGSAGTHLWVDRDLELIGVLMLQWSDAGDQQLNSYRERFQHLVYAALTEDALRESARAASACAAHTG